MALRVASAAAICLLVTAALTWATEPVRPMDTEPVPDQVISAAAAPARATVATEARRMLLAETHKVRCSLKITQDIEGKISNDFRNRIGFSILE